MPDWRSFMEKEFLFAYDLKGRDCPVTISHVTGGEVVGEGGKKTKKPIVHFAGTKKKLALNSTNGKTIAALYGNDVEQWKGKRVTLYPSVTQFGGKEVDCIRVRPTVPPAPKGGDGPAPGNDAATGGES